MLIKEESLCNCFDLHIETKSSGLKRENANNVSSNRDNIKLCQMTFCHFSLFSRLTQKHHKIDIPFKLSIVAIVCIHESKLKNVSEKK